MPSWVGPWEIVWGLGCILVAAIFLINLQTALTRCSSQNRSLDPGLVWLSIIPLFGLAWLFVVVCAMGKSLGAEFRARGVAAPNRPAQSVGLAMAVALAASAPFFLAAITLSYFARAYGDVTYNLAANLEFGTGALGILLGFGGFVFAVVYWVSVRGYSARLVVPSSWDQIPTVGPGGPGRCCWNCGGWVEAGSPCPRCWAPPDAGASGPAAAERTDAPRL